jgi:hypothetical protein
MPTPPADLSPPWNHVFVDFENVTKIDFAALGTKPATYTLLLGAKQTRLETGLVEELMKHAGKVELVRLTSSGKNALDFALAYYIGRAAVVDPTGYFHIVSKDQGFDPLIDHLKSRQIRAHRHDDFSTLSFSGPPKRTAAAAAPRVAASMVPLPELPLERALQHLKKHPNNRPKQEKTLVRHLRNLLGKTATEADAQALMKTLKDKGHVRITDKGPVSYHLPS